MVVGDRNSDLSQIAVNTHNIPDDSIDCGIRLLGWCRGATCQKYARLRTFIIIFTCAGILQGACETYFRITAKEAAFENGYNPLIIDWLLVSSGIFQAIFALTFAHWAFKLHPISWLSGVIVLQALTCVVAVIPSIINFADNNVVAAQTTLEDSMCATSLQSMQRSLLSVEQSQTLTLVLLFVLQLALGLGSLVYYIIGITYVDDNSQSIDSAAVIGAAYGSKLFGLQVGCLLTLGVDASGVGWWLGWVILGPLILVSGILLGLFPKRLPKTVLHQAAQRILEETRSRQFGSQFSTYIDDTNFGPSVKRIFSNKLLMFNIVSIMFIQAATVNYMLQEEDYLQSRFFLPFNEENGLKQEWNAAFVSYFLKPPVAAIGMLIGGLVISKLKLSGRKITAINIVLGINLLVIYIAYVFIKCDVGPMAGVVNGKLQQPYCARQCICQPTAFMPICPENSTVTYFSPCYAGCTSKTTINNIEFYEGCSCGSNFEMSWTSIRATEGACSSGGCYKMLVVFQVLSVSAAGVLGFATIGKIIITLRSVLPQDKALALAMEVMFFGLFAYVPVHLAYDIVTRTTCTFWAPEYARCLLRETPIHGNILNVMSAALILAGLLFDVLVFIYAKGLNIYNCKVTDVDYTPSLYAPIPHEDRELQTPIAHAIGGSPATATTTASSPTAQRDLQPTRSAPNPSINVFRNPSSLTNSSAGETTMVDPQTGVTYAQVVFPPDKHKPDDGTTSPKRMAVRADVPVHHLSASDVRSQLGNLKSFNVKNKTTDAEQPAAALLPEAVNTAITKPAPATTDLDALRPQSPETDF